MFDFFEYYEAMMLSGDCDPAYPALNYICDRYELNIEQRYWIAFLYGTNYCVPTTFYIYNEFPDFENVDVARLENWWLNNKDKLVFQTDKLRVKSNNQFVKCFESYRELIGNRTQDEAFKKLENYDEVYEFAKNIYTFGRFSLFNYIEALNKLAKVDVYPPTIELKDAESSRNGLCYAVYKENLIQSKLTNIDIDVLQQSLDGLFFELTEKYPEFLVTFWNVETVLCAYKKLHLGRRYVGYYIDRQQEEILKLQSSVKDGVDWSVLWDFRREFFNHSLLGEYHGRQGIDNKKLKVYKEYKKILIPTFNIEYKDRVNFPESMRCYNE
jgi:hypothetical protein